MQVFDTSPKLNVGHNTETNSSQSSDVWFEGPCPISLSVKKATFGWLQRATQKKRYRVRLKSITLDEKYEIKNIIIVLKCKKMFLFEKFDKNIQFNSGWCKAGDFFI